MLRGKIIFHERYWKNVSKQGQFQSCATRLLAECGRSQRLCQGAAAGRPEEALVGKGGHGTSGELSGSSHTEHKLTTTQWLTSGNATEHDLVPAIKKNFNARAKWGAALLAINASNRMRSLSPSASTSSTGTSTPVTGGLLPRSSHTVPTPLSGTDDEESPRNEPDHEHDYFTASEGPSTPAKLRHDDHFEARDYQDGPSRSQQPAGPAGKNGDVFGSGPSTLTAEPKRGIVEDAKIEITPPPDEPGTRVHPAVIDSADPDPGGPVGDGVATGENTTQTDQQATQARTGPERKSSGYSLSGVRSLMGKLGI